MKKINFRNLCRSMAILLAVVLVASACKPKNTTSTDEKPTQGPTTDSGTTANDTPTSNAESPDKLLEAYLTCFEQGDWDKAQSYIWPYAEKFAGTTGTSVQALRDSFQNLGYGSLNGGDFLPISIHEDYTLYSVTYSFTPELPPDSVTTDMITVVKVDGNYFISPNNLLCAYEIDPSSLAVATAATPQATDDAGDQTDDIPVAPDEPLSDDEASEPEHQIPIAGEEIDSQEGVIANVVAAATYANGVFFDVEIDNASDTTLSLGSEDTGDAFAVLEGVVITAEQNASVDLAKDHGFALGSEDEGALDSQFDTFAGQFEVPATQKAHSELFFTQDLRMIYNLYYPEIHLGDNIRSLPINFSGLKVVEGGLMSCAYLINSSAAE